MTMKYGDVVEVYEIRSWSVDGRPVFGWFRDRKVLSVHEHTVLVGAPGIASDGATSTMGCYREYNRFAVRAQR